MNHIKFLLLLAVVACSSKPINEMDKISGEVLKRKEGIDIQFKPLEEEKGVEVANKKF